MGPQPVLYAHRDSNTSFYLPDRMSSKQSKNRSIQKPCSSTPIVHIYEASKLLNISKELAKEYSLDKRNIIMTCRKNRALCEEHGRHDLMPIWTLAEMIATPNVPDENKYEMLFYKDPFKKFLLEALIMHFAAAGDLQTAVMLSCLFHKCVPSPENESVMTPYGYASKLPQLTPTTSPYHTVLPVDNQAKTSASNLQLKQLRSNSWSDSLDWSDGRLHNSDAYSCSLIRRAKMPLFDQFKKVYADILCGWQLLTNRALILKHTMYSKTLPQGVDFVVECSGCSKTKRTPNCGPCRRPVFYCVLCRLPVKGAANACLACGHGGHMLHILQWFQNHEVCASGCGCRCLERTSYY